MWRRYVGLLRRHDRAEKCPLYIVYIFILSSRIYWKLLNKHQQKPLVSIGNLKQLRDCKNSSFTRKCPLGQDLLQQNKLFIRQRNLPSQDQLLSENGRAILSITITTGNAAEILQLTGSPGKTSTHPWITLVCLDENSHCGVMGSRRIANANILEQIVARLSTCAGPVISFVALLFYDTQQRF